MGVGGRGGQEGFHRDCYSAGGARAALQAVVKGGGRCEGISESALVLLFTSATAMGCFLSQISFLLMSH